MSARRIFVGDVQGCREELQRLLDDVRFDPASDALEPVGDFVNRGPDSAGVLRLCRGIGAGGVLGNHDVHALRVHAGLRRLGEHDTLAGLLRADDADDLLGWLAERPLAKDQGDVLLVHAGIDPTWDDPVAVLAGLDPLVPDPRSEFALRVRYCDARGRRPESDWPPPPPPFRPWYEHVRASERRTLVFGHWARNGLVVRERLRGLDTGCVWGGALTAWIAEEDRIVQVPAARAYAAYD